ncbi:hypothetical protein CV102_04200 [Natronococcus pandeyae]|uniref:DUF1616 domain-containing protein n=1 Tax=Natronococcus pandeyae TaxID=2055836 RepID=A0A8J8TSW0_9EURY|nr:DUF1616 domain-containing protein [Natronococcus pandeyae]TYL39505.1 hypothetical protein CV102_04200 [Natronococcus pandeyae]
MSDSDWWFLDLALVIAVTGLVTFGLFIGVPGPVRILLGIPFLLFLPGYALVSVLYPDKFDDEYQSFDDEKTTRRGPVLSSGGLGSIERFVLSVVASIAVVPAVTLVTSATPWGITVRPVVVGIALTTIVFSLLAIVQRYRCPPEQRFALSLSGSSLLFSADRNSYGRSAPSPMLYNAIFLVALAVLLVTAGFAVATGPPEHDGYTEFYIETEEVHGEMEVMYDDSLSAGESQSQTAYITNEEHEERSYTTVVALQQVSYEDDSVTVHEQDVLASESATVADGETHEQTLEFEPSMTGDDLRLVLYLYEGEPPEDPTEENAYRTIELPVTVS